MKKWIIINKKSGKPVTESFFDKVQCMSLYPNKALAEEDMKILFDEKDILAYVARKVEITIK
jgi:hypothetical protein